MLIEHLIELSGIELPAEDAVTLADDFILSVRLFRNIGERHE